MERVFMPEKEEKRSESIIVEEISGEEALALAEKVIALLNAEILTVDEAVKKIDKAFQDKRIKFDEESFSKFQKLPYAEVLLKTKAFKNAIEWYNSPERRIEEVFNEVEELKGVKEKVIHLIGLVDDLKIKIEEIEKKVQEIDGKYEETSNIREEIEDIVREYIELYKSEVQVSDEWIQEQVIAVLRMLEEQAGISESQIRADIEYIVREEVEKVLQKVKERVEEQKVEEPKVEYEVQEVKIEKESQKSVQEEKKKKFPVPDIVIYIVLALGLMFFVVQLLK